MSVKITVPEDITIPGERANASLGIQERPDITFSFVRFLEEIALRLFTTVKLTNRGIDIVDDARDAGVGGTFQIDDSDLELIHQGLDAQGSFNVKQGRYLRPHMLALKAYKPREKDTVSATPPVAPTVAPVVAPVSAIDAPPAAAITQPAPTEEEIEARIRAKIAAEMGVSK